MRNEHQGPDQADPFSADYMNGLYGYAMVLTHNHAEAEDLVQETYVRAIAAMSRLRPDSNIKAWLFKILRNIWFNQLRKRRSDPQIVQADMERDSLESIANPEKNAYEVYAGAVERERVRAAIQELSLEFREVILLREYEELSYQEIATLLDCPQGTVMSRLARARSKLRVILSSPWTRPELSHDNRAK